MWHMCNEFLDIYVSLLKKKNTNKKTIIILKRQTIFQ